MNHPYRMLFAWLAVPVVAAIGVALASDADAAPLDHVICAELDADPSTGGVHYVARTIRYAPWITECPEHLGIVLQWAAIDYAGYIV